jgi:glucose dehydrogenase
MPMRNRLTVLAGVVIVAAMFARVGAQTGASGTEWRTYGGDLGHTKYATLSQINADNVKSLKIA